MRRLYASFACSEHDNAHPGQQQVQLHWFEQAATLRSVAQCQSGLCGFGRLARAVRIKRGLHETLRCKQRAPLTSVESDQQLIFSPTWQRGRRQGLRAAAPGVQAGVRSVHGLCTGVLLR